MSDSLKSDESVPALFQKWTTTKQEINGWTIDCKKGLWGVFAPTYLQAIQEASHYFRQYQADGEYV